MALVLELFVTLPWELQVGHYIRLRGQELALPDAVQVRALGHRIALPLNPCTLKP